MKPLLRSADRPTLKSWLALESLEGRDVPATAFSLLPPNSLVAFDTANPAAANAPIAITGLGTGENLVGIDFRPQNGQLYGLATDGAGSVRLYAISQRTGTATPLTAAPVQFSTVAAGVTTPTPITGVNFGFDFNPTVDRIRVVTDDGFNFRLNPNTGALVDNDNDPTNGVQPDGDIGNAGSTVTTGADGAAYTNNSPNATATTQYTLDSVSNTLFIQNPPNSGDQTNPLPVTLNGAPLDFTGVNGFDIPAGVDVATSNTAATGRAFAALTTATTGTRLYGIELSTGVATDLGPVAGGTTPANGLAIQSEQPGTGTAGNPLIAFSQGGFGAVLARFNSATPGTTTNGLINGLQNGETLVGIDFRPATGQLFGLGINDTANTGTLYLVDPQTGPTGTPSVTPVGTVGGVAFVDAAGAAVDLPAASAGYGFDFNPTVDRIRVTTGTGLNFRLNPNTGAAVDGNTTTAGTNPDANITGSGSAGVTAVAYTNSFGQPLAAAGQPAIGTTTQYTLDSATDTLFIQNPPNTGTQTNPRPVTVGGVALDFTEVNGFDIPAGVRTDTSNAGVTSGFGFAGLTVGGTTSLYRIDLTTGAATNLGAFDTGFSPLGGLAAGDAPTGTVAFSAATFTVTENGGTATITLTRTGGSTGALTVNVAATGGTATGGTDFGPVPATVTFADGQTTATVVIPITDDNLNEPNETVVLTLTNPTNGAVLGAQTTTTLTITDNDPAPAGTIQFAAAAATATENSGSIVLTLTRTGGTTGAVTVMVEATGGTATSGSDFTGVPATVTFADGQTTATLTLPILDDTAVEGDETAILTLSAPTGGAVLGTQTTTTLTITDNDTVPTAAVVQFAAPTFPVAENAGTATVILTRTGGTTGAVTVTVMVTGGTASNGTDFGPVPMTVTFADGQTSATLAIPITNNTMFGPPSRSVELTLSAPTGGATLGTQATTTLLIFDDDTIAPPVPTVGAVQFGAATYTGAEGGGSIAVTLTRTGGTTGALTVSVTATGGTATSGTDFTGVPATVTFAAGQTTATLVIPVLDDTTAEGTETVTLALSGPTGGATLGTQTTTTLTITDNDVVTRPGVSVTAPFLAGGPVGGAARLLTGTGGTFALGSTVTFPGITGNARVAVADINGDGTPDYVGGAGPGGASRVVVIDGKSNTVLASFDAFEAAFNGGVFVAAGDIDGDGRAEVVVTPDQGGGPVVAIYRGSALAAGATGEAAQIVRFFGIEDPAFRGGARAALGDITGDGRADLVVSAGFLGGPRVALFDGASLTAGGTPVKLVGDFFAFEDTLRNGSFVAAGDITGDGRADLIFGGGPGGGPRVRVFDGAALLAAGPFGRLDAIPAAQRANFFAGDSNLRGGVRVAAHDADGNADNRAELLVGSGEGESSRVRLYRSANLLTNATPTADQEFDPFGAVQTNGVFVG